MTRLSGAKANEMRYDHEKASFRVEYEASLGRRTTAKDDEMLSSPMIECEIRCDMDTWAHSLDIVVDPPPQTLSCLRRHRLSTEGGGLWLSMMHDAMFVDDDRLLAIIRRAPGKEKGLVMVNGAKITVDIEELSEQEIKALTKQKRVKPPRIPLDQPPVDGVIRRRRAEWDTDSGAAGGSDDTQGGYGRLGAWASAPQISSPLTRWLNYAVESATATTQQAVAAISPAGASGSMAVPSGSKLPMQYALEALAWVQETHSVFPSSGWEAVGDKGLPVLKKLAPEICPVIPVHKGFKVIERVSAEELAAIVTEPECRKKWDDRYSSVQVLEAYGGESRTSFVVSKAGFPWRDRGFHIASVIARAVTSPSASRRASSSSVVTEQSNGVKNAIFCVSASFSPDSVARFSPAKYNLYALPVGRVYVDAWVLETLDPYTKENYAIPSTRCTRLVAVDFAGAIPAAVNSMINAALPRAVLAVEAFVKGFVSQPLTRLPAPGLVITDKKMDEHLATVAWKLKKKDENRLLVDTRYNAEGRVYSAVILVTIPKSPTSPPPPLKRLDGSPVDQLTPRPGRPNLGASPSFHFVEPSPELVQQHEVPTTLHEDIIPRSLTVRNGSPSSDPSSPSPVTPSIRHRSMSSSAPLDVTTPGSYIRGRTLSSAFTSRGEMKPCRDLIVAELVIESKLYPEGYDVVLKSRMRSGWRVGGAKEDCMPLRRSKAEESSRTASDTTLAEDEPLDVLPLAHTIHTMPSSALHSSGLYEGENPSRHLLRLSLPTAQYQVATVRDPLTGELQTPPPAPSWLTGMKEGGAVVFVEVRPRKDVPSAGGSVKEKRLKVRVDGTEVKVVGEKESLTSLGREELLDDRVLKMGVLLRYDLFRTSTSVSRAQYCIYRMPSDAEPLPDDLKIPVALADDLLVPVSASTTTHDPTSAQSVEDKDISEASDKALNTASILFLASCESPILTAELLITRHLISNLP